SGSPSPFVIALCAFGWIWGASLFVPFATYLYYRARRLSLLERAGTGEGNALTAQDIDQYVVPLTRSWQGPPRIGIFSTGNGRTPPLTRFARGAGIALTALFYLALLAALLIAVFSGFLGR